MREREGEVGREWQSKFKDRHKKKKISKHLLFIDYFAVLSGYFFPFCGGACA